MVPARLPIGTLNAMAAPMTWQPLQVEGARTSMPSSRCVCLRCPAGMSSLEDGARIQITADA